MVLRACNFHRWASLRMYKGTSPQCGHSWEQAEYLTDKSPWRNAVRPLFGKSHCLVAPLLQEESQAKVNSAKLLGTCIRFDLHACLHFLLNWGPGGSELRSNSVRQVSPKAAGPEHRCIRIRCLVPAALCSSLLHRLLLLWDSCGQRDLLGFQESLR